MQFLKYSPVKILLLVNGQRENIQIRQFGLIVLDLALLTQDQQGLLTIRKIAVREYILNEGRSCRPPEIR